MQIKPAIVATTVLLGVPASVFAQMSCAALGEFLATAGPTFPRSTRRPLSPR
jgi:hypothetical protein